MNHWQIFLWDIPEKCIPAQAYFLSHSMNLKPTQSANSYQLVSLVRFPLLFPWHSSSTLLFSPPPPAIKVCNEYIMCIIRWEHTQDHFLPLYFTSRILQDFSPFALASLYWLVLGFTIYFHFFSWLLCRRKTVYAVLLFEICKEYGHSQQKKKGSGIL